MGNDTKNRRYNDDFRAAAVALVIDNTLPASRAEQVGMAYETLRGWIEASGRQQEVATEMSDKQCIRELERELRSMILDRKTPKEAVGILSQHPN